MIALWVSSLIWSASFGLIKHQLAGVDPWFIATMRIVFSLVVFLPFVFRMPIGSREGTRLMGIGAIQLGLMYSFYTASFQYLSAYEVATLTITTPIFVVLADAWIERRWKLGETLGALLAVAAAGALVRQAPSVKTALTGVVLVQVCNVVFAIGQILYRKVRTPGASEAQRMLWLYAGATAMTAAMFVFRPQSPASATLGASQWASLVYLGVVPTGIAFALWNYGSQRVSAGLLAVMNNAKIPLAVLLAWVVFGEAIRWQSLLVSSGIFALAFLCLRRNWKVPLNT